MYLKIGFLCLAMFANGNGYFLSLKQKGELLVNGTVTDKSGNKFNVRIVPGYKSSLSLGSHYWNSGFDNEKLGFKNLGRGLLKVPTSAKHFKMYFEPNMYKGIGEGFRQGFRAEKYLFKNYMGINLANAWTNYLSLAYKAHQKKSFGWWFSYPWAVIKGTINTALRIVTGIPTGLIVLTYPIVIRPSYEILSPIALTLFDVVEGSFDAGLGLAQLGWGVVGNQLIGGVIFPVSSQLWTTFMGLPLGFFGKEPTIESEDGWWVVMLPESPGYAKKIELKIGEMPDEFSKIIKNGINFYEFEEDLEPYKIEHDSNLSNFEKMKKAEINRFQSISDSLRTIHNVKTTYEYRSKLYLSDDESDFVKKIVIEYLNKSGKYNDLGNKKIEKLAEFITNRYGWQILARPRGELLNSQTKTTPSSLIKEEAGEILINK